MAKQSTSRRLLITGTTGKVGQHFLEQIRKRSEYRDLSIRVLCHNRSLELQPQLEVVHGSIADRAVVRRAIEGVTHVVHLATCKEVPEDIMDIAIKGLFWLLEECRSSPVFQQVILVGGDAALGHFFYPHQRPIVETQKHSAYPGCYALSKVLEEVMLEQYYFQYNLNGCCLRAPWIMEKDDFKFSLSFGADVFGGPCWRDLVGKETADQYHKQGVIPLMLDPNGEPVKRNFVHVSDLVEAIFLALDHPKSRQQTFNICMDEPVDYAQVAEFLNYTRGLPSVKVKTSYWSTWLDNSKAKFLLGWRPRYEVKRLIDEAWDYQRGPDDPRRVWYPG